MIFLRNTLFVHIFISRIMVSLGSKLYNATHSQRLTGQPLLGIKNITLLTECQVICESLSACSGTNFGPVAPGYKGYTCELYDAEAIGSGTLEDAPGWIFMGMYTYIFKSYQVNAETTATSNTRVIGGASLLSDN